MTLKPDEIRSRAYEFLDERRIPHVAGCESEAVRLATRWGEDAEDAAVAGILHDITKKLSYNEQLQLCKKYDIVGNDDLISSPKLLHAVTGPEVARENFGINDKIYAGIRWHTTGRPDMTTFEKIIYLADYIEPTRIFDGVEKLRALAYRDIDEAMALALKMSINEIRTTGRSVYADTENAYNFYNNIVNERRVSMLSPAQIAGIAARALDDKKARDIKILKTAEQTVLADYFVICNGTSSTHIKALVNEVDRQLSEAGEPPIRREGLRSDIWVLMDFGSVIVHIFTDEARKFYNLERLWSDSEEVEPSSLLSP